MSPLWRYDGALGVFVGVLILANVVIGRLPQSAQGAAIVGAFIIAFGTFAYANFMVRCPNCGKRLQDRHTGFSRGLPGRSGSI